MDAQDRLKVESFASTVFEYLDLIQNHSRYSLIDFLELVNPLLATLYTKTFELPKEDDEVDNEIQEEFDTANSIGLSSFYTNLKDYFGAYDDFKCFYNPYEDPKPVTALLSECLNDIYRDLSGGMKLYNSQRYEDAVWEWKFSFQIHWGTHLTEALHAIHSLIINMDVD